MPKNPQKENGYIAIANELWDALAHIRINGEARQVLDVILRKTYGFNKKADCIPLSQFVEATGMSKIGVRKGLNKLLAMGIVTQKGNAIANEYGVVKDYSLWRPLPKKVTVPKKVTTVTQKGNKSYPKSAHQKTKANTKDITDAEASDAKLIVAVIDAFEQVNPTGFKKWYARPPMREACRRLVELHGLDLVQRVCKMLPISNGKPYFPTITTPLQLEDKWAALESAWRKEKEKGNSKKVKIV